MMGRDVFDMLKCAVNKNQTKVIVFIGETIFITPVFR